MVAFQRVRLVCRLRGAEIVTKIAIRVESIPVEASKVKSVSLLEDNRKSKRQNVRIRVALFVVMQGVAVQDHGRALGNEHAVVHEIFRRAVRRRVPEWGVDTEDLFDGSPKVWKVLLVLGTGPTVSSDHTVKLVLAAGLHVRVLANESEEPLDDTGCLRTSRHVSLMWPLLFRET